jgi:hypothetical protein
MGTDDLPRLAAPAHLRGAEKNAWLEGAIAGLEHAKRIEELANSQFICERMSSLAQTGEVPAIKRKTRKQVIEKALCVTPCH